VALLSVADLHQLPSGTDHPPLQSKLGHFVMGVKTYDCRYSTRTQLSIPHMPGDGYDVSMSSLRSAAVNASYLAPPNPAFLDDKSANSTLGTNHSTMLASSRNSRITFNPILLKKKEWKEKWNRRRERQRTEMEIHNAQHPQGRNTEWTWASVMGLKNKVTQKDTWYSWRSISIKSKLSCDDVRSQYSASPPTLPALHFVTDRESSVDAHPCEGSHSSLITAKSHDQGSADSPNKYDHAFPESLSHADLVNKIKQLRNSISRSENYLRFIQTAVSLDTKRDAFWETGFARRVSDHGESA